MVDRLYVGIDTSNYATSLAVANASTGGVVYTDKRFLPVKPGGLGLRQSNAVYQHLQALPGMLEDLLSSFDLQGISGVGASEKPRPTEGSHMPCFLAGVGAARVLAAARGVPLYITTHQQGHLAAAVYGAGCPQLLAGDFLFFHVSGGTTELLLARGYSIIKQVGGTADLYAGQAVDRLGVKLGLPFPAGEALSRLAAECTQPVNPKISVKGAQCSLSGLQNQCEKLLEQGAAPAYAARFCLTAIAETAAAMLCAARAAHPGLPVLCAGGVMASDIIRPLLQARLEGINFAPPAYSADNAAGVALIAAGEGENG